MNRHLKPEEIKRIKQGTAVKSESLAALEHISQCGQCARMFYESFSEAEQIFPSGGFAERVEAALKKPYITVTPVSVAEKGFRKAGAGLARGADGGSKGIAQEERPRQITGTPKKKDLQRELRIYSLKVGVAACAALLLMAAGSLRFDLHQIDGKTFNGLEFTRLHAVTEYVRSLTDGMLNWEDKNND